MIILLSLVSAAPAPAPGGGVRSVRLENTKVGLAVVTIRSADGRVLKEVGVPGRTTRSVTLDGVAGGVRIDVARGGASGGAAAVLAGAVAAGAARGRGSEAGERSGAVHYHGDRECHDPSCPEAGGTTDGGGDDAALGDVVGGVLRGTRTRDDDEDEGGGTFFPPPAAGTTASGLLDGVKIVLTGSGVFQAPAGGPSTINIQNVDEPAHHCQGARLLMIVGDFADPTIQASLRWAETLQGPGHRLHMIGYPTGGGDREPTWSVPHVPPPAGHRPSGVSDIWPRYQEGGRNKNLNDLTGTWRDACFFEEVMVMFHGGQVGSFRGLVAQLPAMLNHRPVKKLVIWSCRSTNGFYPGEGGAGGERNYRRIAHIVRPQACPCACRPGVCVARGPRGERTRCPTAEDDVTILASALVEGRAAKLGLDPGDARAPLSTPTGELRRITVTPEGAVRAEFIPAGIEVFDGKRSKADPELARGSSARVNPERVLQEARTQDPENYPAAANPYTGPRCCGNGEGCRPNDDEGEQGMVR